MRSHRPKRRPSAQAVQQLQAHSLHVGAFVSAQHLWDRVFTMQDRQRFGHNLQECFSRLGTVGMWREVHGGSPERAVIETAYAIGFLDQNGYQWLLREIGAGAPSLAHTKVPRWNPATGELQFGREIIRKVRVLRNRSGPQMILDAFQRATWPLRIDNPLDGGQQQLHDVLRTLNRGLRRIRFRAQEGGGAVVWERV